MSLLDKKALIMGALFILIMFLIFNTHNDNPTDNSHTRECFMEPTNDTDKRCKKLHVVFGHLNRIEYTSEKPPCARGAYSCIKVESVGMPPYVQAWKCFDLIDEPQNDFL